MNKEFRKYCSQLSEWHPLKTFIKENDQLILLLNDLKTVEIESDWQAFINIFNQIIEIDIRYTRKENQLFPFLEKRGWTGPSQGMWAFHDSIRAIIKDSRYYIANRELIKIKRAKRISI